MAQFGEETNRTQTMQAGSRSITQRWPAKVPDRAPAARVRRWVEMLEELEGSHDGWQPVRWRDSSAHADAAPRRGVG